MALCNSVTSAHHFESTVFASKWWALMTQCLVPEEQPPQTQSFFKHIFLIIKLLNFNFTLAYRVILFKLIQKHRLNTHNPCQLSQKFGHQSSRDIAPCPTGTSTSYSKFFKQVFMIKKIIPFYLYVSKLFTLIFFS
jgi:hypothetical protein